MRQAPGVRVGPPIKKTTGLRLFNGMGGKPGHVGKGLGQVGRGYPGQGRHGDSRRVGEIDVPGKPSISPERSKAVAEELRRLSLPAQERVAMQAGGQKTRLKVLAAERRLQTISQLEGGRGHPEIHIPGKPSISPERSIVVAMRVSQQLSPPKEGIAMPAGGRLAEQNDQQLRLQRVVEATVRGLQPIPQLEGRRGHPGQGGEIYVPGKIAPPSKERLAMLAARLRQHSLPAQENERIARQFGGQSVEQTVRWFLGRLPRESQQHFTRGNASLEAKARQAVERVLRTIPRLEVAAEQSPIWNAARRIELAALQAPIRSVIYTPDQAVLRQRAERARQERDKRGEQLDEKIRRQQEEVDKKQKGASEKQRRLIIINQVSAMLNGGVMTAGGVITAAAQASKVSDG